MSVEVLSVTGVRFSDAGTACFVVDNTGHPQKLHNLLNRQDR